MSTLRAARVHFGGYGRQNSGILHVFVYFLLRAISSSQSSAFHKKRQPKQSTAFKIGSSNPCIKEKGARSEVIKSKQPRIKRGEHHPLRSTLYPVSQKRRSHSKGPAVRFLALQAGCRAQKQDFSRRSPVNHLFFISILAPEAEDESGNDRTDDNGKNVAERVVCKRRYPEAAVRCGNGYVPQADESS